MAWGAGGLSARPGSSLGGPRAMRMEPWLKACLISLKRECPWIELCVERNLALKGIPQSSARTAAAEGKRAWWRGFEISFRLCEWRTEGYLSLCSPTRYKIWRYTEILLIKIKGHCTLSQIKHPPFTNPSLRFFEGILRHTYEASAAWKPDAGGVITFTCLPRQPCVCGTDQNLSWQSVADNLRDANTWSDSKTTFFPSSARCGSL